MEPPLCVGVLNADADRLAFVSERLGTCACVAVSFDAETGALTCSADDAPDVVLVCGSDNPEGAVELCRQVREAEGKGGVPLLLAVTAYQMFAAHDLKRIPNSHYVLTPLDEPMVRDRVEMLQRGQDW